MELQILTDTGWLVHNSIERVSYIFENHLQKLSFKFFCGYNENVSPILSKIGKLNCFNVCHILV